MHALIDFFHRLFNAAEDDVARIMRPLTRIQDRLKERAEQADMEAKLAKAEARQLLLDAEAHAALAGRAAEAHAKLSSLL